MAIEDFTRVCANCKIEKPIGEFYTLKRRGRKEYAYWCKICANERRMHSYLKDRERKHHWYCKNLDGNRMKHKEWRDAIRQKAQDYFSDICFLCDKKVFIKKADFNIHHKDGSNNHNGHAMWHPEDWDRCVLLCKGCHYMLHGTSRLPKNKFSTLLHQLRRKV